MGAWNTTSEHPGSQHLGSVLIVDDDPAIIRLIDRLLANHYHEAVTRLSAPDARSAEQIIRNELVDLVITDLSMGDVSGFRLVHWLKGWDPLIQVLVVTGNESPEALRRACAEGACDYFVKPFRRLELLQSVDFALKRMRRWDGILAHAEVDELGSCI